jgi:hypothetical protein
MSTDTEPLSTSNGAAHDRVRQHWLVFDDPEQTLSAVKRLRGAGYEIADVHSPFPVHGLDEALGWRDTRLPWATLVGGGLGLCIAMALQTWTHALDWPLNIGGKTDLAIPALVPVAFELTVLLAAFATVGGLLVRSRLKPTSGGDLPAGQPLADVTDNRFVVRVVERDGSFAPEDFERLVKRLRPRKVLRNRRAS